MLTFTLPFKLNSIEKLKGQSNYTQWATLVFHVLKFYDFDELANAKSELPMEETTRKIYNKRAMSAIMTIQLTIDQDQ